MSSAGAAGAAAAAVRFGFFSGTRADPVTSTSLFLAFVLLSLFKGQFT